MGDSRTGGRFTGVLSRRRLWTGAALLLALVWLAAAGPLGAFMGRLADVQTNDRAAFLPVGAESTRVQEIAERFPGEDALPAVVVYSADTAFDGARLDAVGADAERIADTDWTAGPVLGPVAGTEDPRVAQLIVPIDAGTDTGAAVQELRDILAATAVPQAEVHVSGPAGFSADLVAAFAGIDGTLLVVAVVAVLLILVAVYRSPLLPLVVITASLLALVVSAALVYAAAAAEWITLNGQSQGILFILVVGACTDYALLLVARYREALTAHRGPTEAITAAVRGTVAPILASGGTVILGVLCLLAADLASTRGLGPVAAIGIAAAMLSALTFLPAALLLLGRGAFWPVRPRYRAEAPGGPEPTRAVLDRHRMWGRAARRIARNPRAFWAAAALFLVAASAAVPQFRAEGTAQAEVFRTDVEAVAGQQALERGFGPGSSAAPAVIATDADLLEDVVAAAESVPGVTGAAPVTQPGPPGAPAAPEVVGGTALVEAELAADPESPEAVETVRELRSAVQDVEGADALVGGTTATNLDTLDSAARDLVVVVPLVLVVVFAVLVLLLRALVAPALLMLANVLSFGAALGVGALVFNHVLGYPGADPVVPLFAFVFLVALGVDYSIFLMSRAREEVRGHEHQDGILRALAVTGGVITSAGIVLAATFAALAVIPLLFLAQLAFLVAFGVLLDALLVRSVLVPALSLDIGRRTWWPAGPGRAPRASTGDRTPGRRPVRVV